MRTTLRRRVVPDCVANGDWPAVVPPLLRRIYGARGAIDGEAIDYHLGRLLPPGGLGGLDAAITRLLVALDGSERVVIVGDYDCDGATGSAVAVRGLRLLGFRHVDFAVPHRMRHGYGLSPALVADLTSMPDLIVTVDNGVSSVAGVAAARERGIDVVVTDHHLPGKTLPDAVAMVNPNLDGELFPGKSLAGVGVMFYLLMALRTRMREQGRFADGKEPRLADLLDLVAIGTVADMVPLDYNNRILVAAGLRRIRANRASAGVQALIDACGRDAATLTTTDIGFLLAPRLNAAGRLADMTQGIQCLLTDDPAQARRLAGMLSTTNAERRQLQADMVAEAQDMAGRVGSVDAVGVALFKPDWHAGVVGLVASRIKDRLYRPVVAFAPVDGDATLLRGSARSIPGFHMRDALAAVDAEHPGLIERFGGHAMAAGLSLRRDAWQRFAMAFDAVARRMIDPAQLEHVILTDGSLAPDELTLQMAMILRAAGPWGKDFDLPVFDNVFEVADMRRIGDAHRKFILIEQQSGIELDAVMFRVAEDTVFPRRLRAAYELSVNRWRGRDKLQLILRHVEPA